MNTIRYVISIYDGRSRLISARISDTQKSHENEITSDFFRGSRAMYDDIRIFL